MQVNRRSQADRSAATRASLVQAARLLFAEHGFGGVGTETIVAAAGVTRGALYHQFADKKPSCSRRSMRRSRRISPAVSVNESLLRERVTRSR